LCAKLGPDAVEVVNAVVLVEVIPPGTHKADTMPKFADHGAVRTRITGDGMLTLEPPGIVVEAAFLAADA
jgi:hypothetical protein